MNTYPTVRSPGETGFRWLLLALIAGLALYLSRGVWQEWFGGSGLRPDAEPRAVTPRGDLAADEETTIEIFETVSPSVVYVSTERFVGGVMGLFPAQVSKGTGSGFVWNTDGHVVTNYHVVADVARTNTSCRVRFKSSKEEYAASVVGFDPDHDIAVLYVRAPTSELRPIPVGTSNNLLVGQKVFAIGNPLGYDYTLTSGIISALDRAIQTDDQRQIQNLIQTDAAISPGNSGGPLLDSAGRLIGMNTAVAAGPNASNIGFALPVDTINSIVPEIIRSGTAPRVELGIAALPDQILRANRIERGVMVAQVREGSPAERAGLKGIVPIGNGRAKFGDLIVAVDGVPVNRLIELRAALSKHKLSDTVTLTIQREGQEISLEVPLR